MSDFQDITVIAKAKGSVTIEVVEQFASSALANLFDNASAEEDRLKIGAMLLFGDKVMAGEIEIPDDLDDPEPSDFVTKVTKLEAAAIGTGDSDSPIYRAKLLVQLKHAKHAKCFTVGESFAAVADVGADFQDVLG